VIIFGLVWFSHEKINQTDIIIFKNLKLKLVQTDWFWFGLVFVVQKLVKPRSKFCFCCLGTCSNLHDQDMIEF
jgi:hypothetical protein